MTAPHAKDALFCFATRAFIFATRKTNLDTPNFVFHIVANIQQRGIDLNGQWKIYYVEKGAMM